MALKKKYTLATGTLFSALAIGYVMQFGFAAPVKTQGETERQLTVTSIIPTSSVTVPKMPPDKAQPPELPNAEITLAKVDGIAQPDSALPQGDVAGGFDCDITLTGTPAAGAIVSLDLSAPCQGNERVTFHHSGLMFTDVTRPDGTLQIDVPALTQSAMFIASFDNGDGAVVQTSVTTLPFYDRVAVQWKGNSGLQLHAREFSADYFGEGHVWAAATGDIARTSRGEGGFLTSLGNDQSPEALRAEIYSYPIGTTQKSGEIAMTVEAEITTANCARDIEAQTLELHQGGTLRVRDLTLAMPECDATGDFLVLKNLVEDLTIAAN